MVASIVLTLSAPTTYLNPSLGVVLPAVNAGTPYDVPLVVNAYDANGNIIAGTANYVDSNGSPFSISLATVNSKNGGRGTAYIKGPAILSAPGQAAITLHYDGNWLDHTVVSATARSSAVNMSGATVTLTTIPHSIEYGGFDANFKPFAFTAGPDGNLWATSAGEGAVARITPSGVVTEFTAGISGSITGGITAGPDGNMWVAEFNTPVLAKITPSGSVIEFSAGISNNTEGIVTAPDGNLWFTESGAAPDAIARISTAGAVTESSTGLTPGDNPSSICVGSDGNVWFNNGAARAVGRMTMNGKGKEFTYAGGAPAGNYVGCAQGPDGNIWFSEADTKVIGRVTPSGTVTSFSAGLPATRAIVQLAAGPDGNVWFTDFKNSVGSITSSGVINEYPSGMTINAGPNGITLGPDGNIWYGEGHINKIAKLVW